EKVRENANAAIERIAGRKDMTPEARRAAAARVYKPAREQIQQLLDQHIDKVNAHKQQLARKAFGSEAALDPQTAMAARQARTQVQGIEDMRHAQDMLRDAQFSGDKQLARAVAGVAFERGWHGVVDEWNADGSNNSYMRHVVELMGLPDTGDVAWRISTAASYTSPDAGPDLMGLRDHEISRAAESGPVGPEAA
ncbi:hypothetical protein ACWDFH_31235, partial [Streptomyces kronopolitis]